MSNKITPDVVLRRLQANAPGASSFNIGVHDVSSDEAVEILRVFRGSKNVTTSPIGSHDSISFRPIPDLRVTLFIKERTPPQKVERPTPIADEILARVARLAEAGR